MLVWLFPAGLYFCFQELRDEHLFLIIYGVFATYFAGVMVRLMLTLTPVICVAAAIALSKLFDAYLDITDILESKKTLSETEGPEKKFVKKQAPDLSPYSRYCPRWWSLTHYHL